MTALAGIRPAAYSSVSFAAFRLTDGHTVRLDIGERDSLLAALQAAQARCFHKDCLAIRETDELIGRATVHLYAIRQKQPKWVNVPGEALPKRVQDLYADPICVMDGAVFG